MARRGWNSSANVQNWRRHRKDDTPGAVCDWPTPHVADYVWAMDEDRQRWEAEGVMLRAMRYLGLVPPARALRPDEISF